MSNKLKFLLRYTKLINALYTVLFLFTSCWPVDDVLVRLSLTEQIIKDANLMWISFSVKIHRHFGNREWIYLIYPELLGVFQSWLNSFSIGVWAFHLQWSLYPGVHLLPFSNTLTYSPITLFFKCIKFHQILLLFLTINLAYVLIINIFGWDYSNLNNFFQRH